MEPPLRAARWVAVGAVVAFWALILVAGLVNPGYLLTRDYISALASRGAEQAWLGVGALVLLPVAHLATAVVLWSRTRLASYGLALTVVAGLLVAADRISCPGGAARCGTGPRTQPADWMDAVHGKSVAAYGVMMVLVLITAAIELWGQVGLRGLAVASATRYSTLNCLARSAGSVEFSGAIRSAAPRSRGRTSA